MLRIDSQSHVFPAAYGQLFGRNPFPTRASYAHGRFDITYAPGGIQFSLALDDYAPEAKLAAMDEAGIDVGVLSVNLPGPELLAPELALEGSRICNDYLAEVCARYPGRFVGLASLPLPDVAAAIAELDRAVDDLGLRGFVLFSHINGIPVDAPRFEPLYEHAAARDIPLVLHPTVPVWSDVISDYSMVPMLGFMVDSSIAMLRLILGGVLERHPRLTIVQPHVGGVLPYLMGRIEEQTEIKRRGREHIRRSPGEYFRRVYLDLVSPSRLALQYAYQYAGADRLLFGTDHPWVGMRTLLELAESLDMPAGDKAKILGANAAALFRIGTTGAPVTPVFPAPNRTTTV